MKKIAVLIDFTSICDKALEFAGKIAAQAGSVLVLVHVADFGSETEADSLNEKLQNLHAKAPAGVTIIDHVGYGSFFSVIPTVISDLGVDLVVVPTHGKIGIMQNLLGANIIKLVKTLPVPSLVVQADSVYSASSFGSLLFPVGPHKHFEVKYKQTANFAKVFDSNVVVYTVRNDIRGISDQIRRNINDSIEYFDAAGVKFEEVSEDPKGFSAGYAKHILSYAKAHNIGTICIMPVISEDNDYIGNADKENILLNSSKLPVLCTNS